MLPGAAGFLFRIQDFERKSSAPQIVSGSQAGLPASNHDNVTVMFQSRSPYGRWSADDLHA